MASLDKKVLTRVDEVFIGAVGASKAACTDYGSCRAFTMTTSVEENTATDASSNDAVCAVAFSGQTGTASFIFEDISKENLAACLGGTVSGSDVYFAPSSTPTYRTAYVTGYEMDGDPADVHLFKFYIKPGTTINLNKEQQLLEVEATLMVNSDGKMWEITNETIDTTPPTVTTSPVDGATGVATSANVVWTFSEAIRSDDITARNFFVMQADGTAVPGTLTYDAAVTGITFDPTSALSGATAHIAVCSYARDVAGNQLAAKSVTNFTTA